MQKLLEETLLCDSSQQIPGYQQGWSIIQDQMKQILSKDNKIKCKRSSKKPIMKTTQEKIKVKKNSIINSHSNIRASRNAPLLNSEQPDIRNQEIATRNDYEQCKEISDHCQSPSYANNQTNHPQRSQPLKENFRILSQLKQSFNMRGNNQLTVTKQYRQKRAFSSHSVNVCYSEPNQQQNKLSLVMRSKNKDGVVDDCSGKMKNQQWNNNKFRIREETFGRPRKLTLCYKVDRIRETVVSEADDGARLRGSSFEAFGQCFANQFIGSPSHSYKRSGTEGSESKMILEREQKATRQHNDCTNRDVTSRKETNGGLHLPTMSLMKARDTDAEIQLNKNYPNKMETLFKQHKSITTSEKPNKRLVQLTLGKENTGRGNCKLTKQVKSHLIGQLKLTLRAAPVVQHPTSRMIKSLGRGK